MISVVKSKHTSEQMQFFLRRFDCPGAEVTLPSGHALTTLGVYIYETSS